MRILGSISLALAMGMSSAESANSSDLSPPFLLEANGKPINVEGIGYAAPCVGDFNNDGKRDLLVGQFREGKMRIFLNEGSDKEPEFGDYIWFKEGAETGRVPTG